MPAGSAPTARDGRHQVGIAIAAAHHTTMLPAPQPRIVKEMIQTSGTCCLHLRRRTGALLELGRAIQPFAGFLNHPVTATAAVAACDRAGVTGSLPTSIPATVFVHDNGWDWVTRGGARRIASENGYQIFENG